MGKVVHWVRCGLSGTNWKSSLWNVGRNYAQGGDFISAFAAKCPEKPLVGRCFVSSAPWSHLRNSVPGEAARGNCCLLQATGHRWKEPCMHSARAHGEKHVRTRKRSPVLLQCSRQPHPVPFLNKAWGQTGWDGGRMYRVRHHYCRASEDLELRVNKMTSNARLKESILWAGFIFRNIMTQNHYKTRGNWGEHQPKTFKFFGILMVVIIVFWQCVCSVGKMSNYH